MKELLLRDRRRCKEIAKDISDLASTIAERVSIMHVCGTHEYTVSYYGLRFLLPENVRVIAGPGCPVCVVPAREIDEAVELASQGIRVFSYGDMYKVPGTQLSLAEAKTQGADVRVVYSFDDAIAICVKDKKESVFFAVGFETTAPSIAAQVAENVLPENLRLLVSHRITVPAVYLVLDDPMIGIHGVVAPGHVSAITGADAWSFISNEYGLPAVVAGFEPMDFLLAIDIILRQLRDNEHKLVNEYRRVVTSEGNLVAKKYLNTVFKIVDGEWRGIGVLSKSLWVLREEYSFLDARRHYEVRVKESQDTKPGCRCPEVILGKIVPPECPFFMKACRPERPWGACMVSSEGTCSIWARYGGFTPI